MTSPGTPGDDSSRVRSRPRVLALTHSLSGVDGVGVYAASLLRELLPRCERIEVFLGRRHRGFGEELPSAHNLEIHAVLPMGHVPLLGLPRLAWLLLSSLPTLVRAARRADVVHSLADYPLAFLAVLAARLAGRPVLVSGHGTYSVAPLRYAVHRRLLLWTFRHCDHFLMGAEFALRQVRRHAPPPDDPRGAEVVPYGCVPSDYDAVRAAGESPGVPGPYVLCVGEVKQRKGYHVSLPAFLEAWRQQPDMHFAIVGRVADDSAYVADLRSQITAAGAGGHVHFLGNVSEARKVALMRGAQAFMLTPVTSDEGGFEAFGLVFLEAGAAGRPVVGITDSGAESAITDGSNGFLREADDRAGLAQALLTLFRDDALADRMGAAGRARAEGQTWAAAADRVAELYAEVTASPAGDAP